VTHYTPAVHTFSPQRNLLPEPRLESRFLAGIVSPQPKRESRPLTRRTPYPSIPSINAFMHECSYSDDMNAQVGVTGGFDEDGSRLRSPSEENASPFLMSHRSLNHAHYTHHESTAEYLKISKQYSEDLLKGSKSSQSQAGRRSSLSKRKPSETGLGNEKMSAIDGTRHVSEEIMCIFYITYLTFTPDLTSFFVLPLFLLPKLLFSLSVLSPSRLCKVNTIFDTIFINYSHMLNNCVKIVIPRRTGMYSSKVEKLRGNCLCPTEYSQDCQCTATRLFPTANSGAILIC
jgi:hypothetical protein